MPVTIEIDGVGRVELGDEFKTLPPDQQQRTIEEIVASAKRGAQPQMGWGEWAGDVAKSAGTGLAEGAIGLVGLPGTIKDAMQGGVDWAAEKVLGPRPEGAPQSMKSPLSGAAIKGYVENLTGDFYKPKTTTGEYANTVGEFIPGALIGGGGALKELGSAALKYGVAPGLASEAAGQATEGSSIEPYARALAGIGAGIGMAALPGVKLSAVPRENRLLARAAGDDGLTSATIGQNLDDLGPGGMVMDLGPNLQRQAGALAATPGAQQKTVRDAVTRRADTTKVRVTDQLDDTLGKAPIPSRIEAELSANKEGLTPLYTDALKGAKPVETRALADDLDGLIRTTRGAVQGHLRDIRRMLDVNWDDASKARLAQNKNWQPTQTLDTNAATLLQTRQAIDDIIEMAAEPSVAKQLTPIRQRVDGILKSAAPDIKKVDGMAQDLIRQGQAVTKGQQVLASGREAPRPAEVADMMSPIPAGDLIGPSGVPMRLSQGARAEIDRIVGTNSSDVTALKQLLKGEGSWNRDRLVSVFGQRKADKIFDIVENELRFAKTRAVVDQNSESAARIAAMQEVSPNNLGAQKGFARSAANFQFGDAAASVIDWATGALRSNMRSATNERLAKLLTSAKTDANAVEAALRMVEAARVSGNIGQDMSILLINALSTAKGSQPAPAR